MGDWDATREWGCGDASELIFTDANIQNHPWRPVHHTATRFAEELDYSRSDRRGGGNSEWPLNAHCTCIYKANETHVKGVIPNGHSDYV